MAQAEKLSVAITSEMANTVRQAVDTGDYASVSEVVRQRQRLLILNYAATISKTSASLAAANELPLS